MCLDLETAATSTILCLPSNLTSKHELPPFPYALRHNLAGLSGEVFGLGYAVPSVVDQRTPFLSCSYQMKMLVSKVLDTLLRLF